MNQLFYSSEIRWFSTEDSILSTIYEALPGLSVKESERSDYYLKINGENTGVKIREGKHEIKTRIDLKKSDLGTLETWCKWSYSEEESSILNMVKADLLTDWIRVDKKRWKKKYEILEGDNVRYNESRLNNGCGVEYTEINILGNVYYSFGLEAFAFDDDDGNQNPTKALSNLQAVIKYLKLKPNQFLNMKCASYPLFLDSIIS